MSAAPTPAATPDDLWNYELAKFLFQPVEVDTADGVTLSGECRAMHFRERSVILMTEEHEILVCNVVAVQRKRTPRP